MYANITILLYLSQPSPGVWCYHGTESSHPSNTDGVITQAVMYKHGYYHVHCTVIYVLVNTIYMYIYCICVTYKALCSH